jgi:CO/xanthine dehydrogenase Mo-binding subunit
MFAPRVADASADLASLFQPVAIPNCRIEHTEAPTAIPTGAWRAPAHNANAYAIQCFLDEIAHALGTDPPEHRLSILGNAGDFPSKPNADSPTPYNRIA